MDSKAISFNVFFLFFYTVKVSFVLKVVVNCKSLKPDRLDGIGVYTLQLLRRLVEKRSDWEFIFVYDKIPKNAFTFPSNVREISFVCPTYRPPILKLYLSFLNYICKKEKADVLFSPDGWAPKNTSIPTIVSIHDLNFVRNPEFLPWYWASMYNKCFPIIAQNAAHILTVSEFSKKEIIELYSIPSQKISITYNGVSPEFTPATESEISTTRAKISNGKPYFLFVGTLHERKNIRGVFKSYAMYRNQGGKWPLVVVGNPLFGDAAQTYMGANYLYKDDILFTGRVQKSELIKIYSAAACLFFIPFYEGFGIPVIEAMASGVPVISSSVTSLPEVCGNAALLVPPDDYTEIAQLLFEIESNADLRAELKKRGIERAKQFDWKNEMEKLEKILAHYEKS